MKFSKGTPVPFFFSLCSPLQRDNTLLSLAIEAFKAGRFADALIAVEYVCRRHPTRSVPAMLRARILEACVPQFVPKAWYRAWTSEPDNPLLQDTMLQVWLRAGAASTVVELGPAFLPARCREGKEASLLAILKAAGVVRVGACWRNGDMIEGAVYYLADDAAHRQEKVALLLSNGSKAYRYHVTPNSRFKIVCPQEHGTWSLVFAGEGEGGYGEILHGSPLVFAANERVQASRATTSRTEAAKSGKAVAPPSVDIIIPVYREFKLVKACIESVLASLACNKTHAAIVVVDDASPEAAIVEWLEALAAQGKITLLRNAHNLGFIETVNRGLRCHPDRDALLLNADTLVHGDWIDRMSATLYSAPDIASVTPWSNNGEITSFPAMSEPATAPTLLQLAEVDSVNLAMHASKRIRDIELPVCCGFSMLMKRSVIDEIGMLDGVGLTRGYGEEVDWCLRARAAGYRHMLSAGVFVAHTGTASFRFEKTLRVKQNRAVLESRYPGFYDEYNDFHRRDPLAGLRDAMLAAYEAAGASWLETLAEERAAAGRENRVLPNPLPSSVRRIAVWDNRVASPFAGKVLQLARTIAASRLPVRLLVYGEASEALWHTGVVDVVPRLMDPQSQVVSDYALLGWTGCNALLAEENALPAVLQDEQALDEDFNPQIWFAAWIERQGLTPKSRTKTAIKTGMTTRNKESTEAVA